MTPLETALIERISRTGPLTTGEFMAECLMHPAHGYYTTRDPLGAAGDFITAPEISQMFGEMLGLFLAQCWLDRGRPDTFRLVELGPGRGTLMADILRAAGRVPGFSDAADLHLVEGSPTLRGIQTDRLSGLATPTHHDSIATVPDGSLFLVANEFFDALPTRQFLRDGPAWRERLVGVGDGQLAFGLSDSTRPPFLEHRLADTSAGDLVEHAPAAAAMAGDIGRRIADAGGVALIIDYGDWRSLGDTLQAVRRHERVPPLTAPGEVDLTCHVEFETLAMAAAPAAHSTMVAQGTFLERLGITARANALAARADAETAETVAAQHRRLTHPGEMGTLFKAMALYRPTDPTPPGFDE